MIDSCSRNRCDCGNMSGQNRPSKSNRLVEATQVKCAESSAGLALIATSLEFSIANTSIKSGGEAAAQPQACDRRHAVAPASVWETHPKLPGQEFPAAPSAHQTLS